MSPPYKIGKDGYPSGRTGTGSLYSSPRGPFGGIPTGKSTVNAASSSHGSGLLGSFGSLNSEKMLSGVSLYREKCIKSY